MREAGTPSARHLGLCALALLALGLAYLPRLNAPLIWDDRPTIALNAELARPRSLAEFFSPDYFRFSGEQTWRPLASLSYHLILRAAGPTPWLLRLPGLLLHLLNACLLAWLLRTAGLSTAAGLSAAALFAAHPAHSETLMCVAFNEDLLCGLGLLWMLLAHAKDKTGLAAAGLAAALLSKETGLAGLILTPLYDRLCAPNSTGAKAHRPSRVKAYALYAAVSGLYLWLRFGWLKGPGGEANLSAALPLAERLYYGLSGTATSIRVLLLPLWLRIEYFALPPTSPAEAALRLSGAFLLLALWAAGLRLLLREQPALAFFLAWPLIFFAATSNIVPTGVLSLRLAAERWLYLPSLGFMAVLGHILRPRPAWPALLLLFWGALSWQRAGEWAQESRLWESLLGVYPWCAKAQEGLGEAHFRASRYEEARAAFEKALALRETRQDRVLARYAPIAPPGTLAWEKPSLYRWLGLSYLELGRSADAEGMLLKAVELEPSSVFTYRVLAYLTARAGDFPKAGAYLAKGLALDPADEFLKRLKPDLKRRRLSFKAKF